MRWYWFDRFTEFVSGQRAVAVKSVSMAEDHIYDYFPGHPVMPNSLVLEGLAQVGGILLGEMEHFQQRIVLAKVSRVQYHMPARPGDVLTYESVIENIGTEGALVKASSRVGQTPQADAEYYLAFLNDRTEPRELFEPANFLCMLRAWRLYEVGRDPQGNRLAVPAHLLEAERATRVAAAHHVPAAPAPP